MPTCGNTGCGYRATAWRPPRRHRSAWPRATSAACWAPTCGPPGRSVARDAEVVRASGGLAPAAGAAALLEAALQHGHQVDDFGGWPLVLRLDGFRQLMGLALADLLVDSAHEVATVRVLEPLGLPGVTHFLYEPARHRDFLPGHPG